MTKTNSHDKRQWAFAEADIEANYLDLCRKYVEDENAFKQFRRSGLGGILEGGAKIVGEFSLERMTKLSRLSRLKDLVDEARKNDRIGGPIIYKFDDLPECSSSTLQYLDNAFDIQDLLNGTQIRNITEIGGGFGGLCRILSTCVPFETYTIIDQPEPLKLAEKYLSHYPELAGRTRFISCFNLEDIRQLPSQDLLIACSSMSELDPGIQDFYSNSLILNSTFAYLVYNTIHIDSALRQLKQMVSKWQSKFLVEITSPWHSILHIGLSPAKKKPSRLIAWATGYFSPFQLLKRKVLHTVQSLHRKISK